MPSKKIETHLHRQENYVIVDREAIDIAEYTHQKWLGQRHRLKVKAKS